MVRPKKQHVKTLQRRGSGLCVVVPAELLKLLGWNQDDALVLNVIERSLIVTRIDMPKVPALRKEAEQNGNEG